MLGRNMRQIAAAIPSAETPSMKKAITKRAPSTAHGGDVHEYCGGLR
jgi:hypothetical protein